MPAAASRSTAALAGFLVSRALVSGGIALAMISSPDIFYRQVCREDDDETRDRGARLDSTISVALFLTRSLTGTFLDSFGRKPTLILGCLASGIVRILAARHPQSLAVYTLYRTINACAMAPVMMAAQVFASDLLGGRASPDFIKFSRRLAVFLAVCRMSFARFAARSGLSSVELMETAGKMSLAACLGFLLFTRESLATGQMTRFSLRDAHPLAQTGYFAPTKARRAVGLVLALRAMASYCQGAEAEHRRRVFGWTNVERAQLSIASDAAEVLVPVLLVELLGLELHSLEWDLQISALTLLISALTPFPRLVLLNPFLNMTVQGAAGLNALLEAVKSPGQGEGQLEVALSTFDFPFALVLPLAYARMSKLGGTRAPLLFAAAALVLDARWAVPRARKLLFPFDG